MDLHPQSGTSGSDAPLENIKSGPRVGASTGSILMEKVMGEATETAGSTTTLV